MFKINMQHVFFSKLLKIPNKAIFQSLSIAILCLMSAYKSQAQTYCTPGLNTNTGIYYINNLSTTGGVTNITNNNLAASPGGYGNYTTLSVSAIQGNTFNVSVTGYLFTYHLYIWIDWNQDGDFLDAGEAAYTQNTTAVSSFTAPITIPATATPGSTRMRLFLIRDFTTATFNACTVGNTSVYGDATDYTVTVISAACSGAANAGTTAAAATTVPCNTTTTLSLTGNSSGQGITYQWQYNSGSGWTNFGTNAATQTTPPITQATQYRCNVNCTNPGGSSNISTPITVNVNGISVALGNDTTLCPNVSKVLDAGNVGASYLWNTGANSKTITATTAGTYAVKVTLANGCIGRDTIIITNGIVPVNMISPTNDLCEGSTINLDASNTGSTYLWQPGGETTQTIPVNTAGNYSVNIKSVDGCQMVANTQVIERPNPTPYLQADTAICKNDVITLDAGNVGCSYLWNTTETSQTIQPVDSGTYTVITTTPYQCSIIESMQLKYLAQPYAEGINFIPQFYPNFGKVQFMPIGPIDVTNYLWDFGDGNTSASMSPYHNYSSLGEFLVKLHVFNGCGDYVISQWITIDSATTSIKDLNMQASIAVYPNPAKDQVNIATIDRNLMMQSAIIYDAIGRVILRDDRINNSEKTIDVSTLPSGIYSLHITTDKGSFKQKIQILK
jgi:hypothetical protein